MTETAKALYSFYSGFGIDAYPESNVPEDAMLPYITYTVIEPDWRNAASHQARVWYRSEGYKKINAMVDEITRTVGELVMLPTANGYIAIRPADPLVQYQPVANMEIKVAYLNFQINSYQSR